MLGENIGKSGIEGVISDILYKVGTGVNEFSEFKNGCKLERVLLNNEAAVIEKGLSLPSTDTRLDLVRLRVGDLLSDRRSEISFGDWISKAKKFGLKLCRPEVVFCVAAKMLKEDGVDGPVYLPTKIKRVIRLFSVERDNDGDIQLHLYEKKLVTKRSLVGRDEKFLFDK